MARGRELSPQLRSRICELRSIGFSANRIHKIHPEIPLGTIRTTIRRESQRDDNTTRVRSGRPRILSEEDRDHIYDIVAHQNPHVKMRDLCREVSDKAKKRTMQRLLREMNLRKWLQIKRPALTETQVRARMTWAINHQAYTLANWKRVVWSDECTVERGKGVQPIYTYTRPSEQIKKRDVQPVRGSGKGIKKMLWGCFTHNNRSALVPMEGDPESPGGGVTSRRFQEVYRTWLPRMIPENGEFMHDGARPHTGLPVRIALAEMRVKVMNWPANSPDLNPIESLWALMKARIYQLHPELEHAHDDPTTLEALIEAAQEAWNSIDQGILYRLATTMENRVQAVIDAEGWYTKY
jgi:transposase